MSHRGYKTKNGQATENFTTFTPRAKLESSHSLISNHMKAHYNRIASVQAKTDSHPPVSMQKAMKVRDHQGILLDGSGRHHKSSAGPGIHPTNSYVSLNDTSFDSSDEESVVAQTEQWRNYVTKTGRLTGYIYSSRKNSPVKDGSRKETWKPAFSLNSTGTMHAFYPSLNQSATDGCYNCTATNDKTTNRHSTVVNNEKFCTNESHTIETYTVDKVETPLGGSPMETTSTRKYVTDAEVKEDRIKMQKRQEELEYLGFISGITQDILSRQYLSDTALELLIGCHIERNQHKLDKDKMMEMVAELKQQLGFKTKQ